MNLEAIEQRVLAYLAQAANPLVRVEVLHAHLADHSLAEGMNASQLKDFLSKHDLVRVIESPPQPIDTAAKGEPAGAYAIAKDRVPTQRQLAEMMRQQLDVLLEALRAAREEALSLGESGRLSSIDEAQRRAAALRDKLDGAAPDNVVDFRKN